MHTFDMSPELQELSRITPLLSSMLVKTMGDKIILSSPTGDNTMIRIFNDEDQIGVVKAYMDPGDEYPMHVHEKSYEILIVYSGHLVVSTPGGEDVHLKEGNVLKLDKGLPHRARAIEFTKVLGITIPRDGSYK